MKIKPPKPPKCAYKKCRKEFEKKASNHVMCSYECALADIRDKKEKEWKVRKKAHRESKTDYFKLLQDEINKIARFIDHDQLCISCNKPPKKKNGCHFLSVGGHENIRYNLFNIYLGCEKCNSELGGNVHGYDYGLIQEFGKEFWEYLKFQFMQDFRLLQIKEYEVKEKLKIARKITAELEQNLVKRSAKERLELRKIYNERLGIYKEISYFIVG